MKFFLSFVLTFFLSLAPATSADLAGKSNVGPGFTGRFPIAGFNGNGIPSWVPNRSNPPDIAVNWTLNQAWKKAGGLTTPAVLGITTSRASVKQVVDSNGNWSQVPANVTAVSNLGRSTEEARTNSIRVNDMSGAVAADGVERTTNGNFALNPINASQNTVQNGWQWTTSAGTGTAVWNGSNAVTLTGDGTHNLILSSAAIATVAGVTYTVQSDISTNSISLVASTSANGGGTVLLNVNDPVGVGNKFQFTATTATTFISFQRTSASAATVANISVQSAGKLPTNWSTNSIAGVPVVVSAVGSESGFNTIDIQLIGTPTTSGFFNLITDGAVSAVYGPTVTFSTFLKLISGSFTNAPLSIEIREATAGNGFLTNASQVAVPNSTTALGLQRFSLTKTLISPTVGISPGYIDVQMTSGNPVNLTFRVGAPQLENNSLINSSVASATVSAAGSGDAGASGRTMFVFGGTGTPAQGTVTTSGGVLTGMTITNPGSYTALPASPAVIADAIFTATGSASSINVTAVQSGTIAVGDTIIINGAIAGHVSSFGTGTGGVGTYNTTSGAFASQQLATTHFVTAIATVNLTPTNNAAAGFATSPIITSGSAALRAADVTSMPVVVGSAYTLFEAATPQAPALYGTNQGVLALSDGTANNRLGTVRGNSGGSFAVNITSAGAAQASPTPSGTWATGSMQNFALSFSPGNSAASASNGTVATSAPSTAPVGLNSAQFGNTGGGSVLFNGLATKDAIWLNQAIPNAQLQALQ